jgi:hypothetical protein
VPEAETIRRLLLAAGLPLAAAHGFGACAVDVLLDGRFAVSSTETGARIAVADTVLESAKLAGEYAAQ